MKHFILLGIAVILLSSCSRYYYAPNMHNVPLFHEKNEVRLAAALSEGDEVHSTEVQAAFAPTNHFGVMANYFNGHGENKLNTGKGNLMEAGIGYFAPVGKDFHWEIYGGYGRGKVTSTYDSAARTVLGIDRLFLQPAIGYTSDYLDIAISGRIASANFRVKEKDSLTTVAFNDMKYIEDNHNSILFEPALTIRGGWKYVKIQSQICYSMNINNPSFKQEQTNVSMALYFSFAERFRKNRANRR